MNKKYRVAIAFMVTLLLVLGSVPMAFADDKQTSIHVHNATGETITAVTVYYTDNTSVDLIANPSETKWEALDQGERVRDQIAKIEITYETSGLNTYYYPDDFGPQGGYEEPIEYSAEGSGSGSINLWVNEIFNLTPEIDLEKTVTPDLVNSRNAEVTYTFKVTNTGEADLVYVVLEDTALNLNINIGSLGSGEEYTTSRAYTIQNDDWDGDTFVNIASVEGEYRGQDVSATDDAIVTYTEGPITPGAIRILKDVPNVTDSAVMFNFTVYDNQQNIVATGAASEVTPLTIPNLTPGAYTVIETADNDYTTIESSQNVTVQTGSTADVTFVNTLKTASDPESGIQIIKTVSPSTVSSKTGSVTYKFEISNIGDVDFVEVNLIDTLIGVNEYLGPLAAGETTTTSITFDLSLLGTESYGNWIGNVFMNTATAIGYYENEDSVRDEDSATVTYSTGGGDRDRDRDRDRTTTVIPTEPTPAAPTPDPVEILDEETPAGPLPKTGGVPGLLLYGLGALLISGGAAIKFRNKIK